jgi:hypothetical protein
MTPCTLNTECRTGLGLCKGDLQIAGCGFCTGEGECVML